MSVWQGRMQYTYNQIPIPWITRNLRCYFNSSNVLLFRKSSLWGCYKPFAQICSGIYTIYPDLEHPFLPWNILFWYRTPYPDFEHLSWCSLSWFGNTYLILTFVVVFSSLCKTTIGKTSFWSHQPFINQLPSWYILFFEN